MRGCPPRLSNHHQTAPSAPSNGLRIDSGRILPVLNHAVQIDPLSQPPPPDSLPSVLTCVLDPGPQGDRARALQTGVRVNRAGRERHGGEDDLVLVGSGVMAKLSRSYLRALRRFVEREE